MITIQCHIPEYLPLISNYVLQFFENQLGLSFHQIQHKEFTYRFSLNARSFSLPAIFLQSEQAIWLKKRNSFPYQLKNIEIHRNEYIAFREEENIYPDILGTIFFCLSRYEEYVCEAPRDNMDRFMPEHSLMSNYLDQPIVDELVRLFKILLQKEFGLSVPERNTSSRILPSHDVDRPFEFLYYTFPHLIKRLGGDLLLRKSPQNAVQRIKKVNEVWRGDLISDPNNTFDWIMSASESAGLTSTFHFLADVTNPAYDHDYKLTNPEIQHLFQEILERNHAIGLHPSFNSSEISGQVSKEADLLRKHLPSDFQSEKMLKSRYHYLRWNTTSVNELEKAQVDVDQTLGYAQSPGFRCGTSHPFPAFNFDDMKASSLIVEPLIVMEQSLISPVYMNLRNHLPDAWNIVSDLKQKCQAYGGNFTILWHNDHLKDDDLKEFYLNCIS